MMHTVLPREEAVEAIFSKIVASPASCEQLREVVYEHLEDEQIFEKNQAEHFTEVLFQAYKNGDISALLLELCGRSMFDLLREAYLIPKKFHGKAGENPVLLTDVDGNLLPGKRTSKKKYGNSYCDDERSSATAEQLKVREKRGEQNEKQKSLCNNFLRCCSSNEHRAWNYHIGTGNPVISGYTGNCAFRSNSWSGTGNHCRSIE